MAGDPPLIIRAVRPPEYEAAGELTVEAYRTLGDAGDEFYDRDLRDIAGRRDSSEILVAEIGGRVIGCVTFVDGLKTLSEVDDPDAATVRMLGVAAEARGRGVGEAMRVPVHQVPTSSLIDTTVRASTALVNPDGSEFVWTRERR